MERGGDRGVQLSGILIQLLRSMDERDAALASTMNALASSRARAASNHGERRSL